MKTLTTLSSILAAGALALAPKPAMAGNDGLAALGGFVGGVIVGASIERHPAPVVVAGPPACYPAPRVIVAPCPPPSPEGYWKEVTVRTWVPECWATRYDHGRHVRYFVPGHYEFRTDRVWVEYRHRDHDRDDHGDRFAFNFNYRR
jgi:hypothetical protein